MDFASPRFAGDPVLEEILNDPDTGTKKLAKGSPVDSVTTVQRALWDMWWPTRAEPPLDFVAPEGFADGDYGPGTERTVQRYKKEYDIRYPPGAPAGTYDGYAGPRTLAALDYHCVLFDELEAATETKFAEMSASAGSSGYTRSAPIIGTTGIHRAVDINNVGFNIFAKRGVGAFFVGHPIAPTYMFTFGGAAGPLGFPVGDAFDESPGVRRQDFEFGSLRSPPGGPAEPVDVPPLQQSPPPTKRDLF